MNDCANDVFCFTCTRANTPARAKLLFNTITEARKTAGARFHWHVIAQKGTLAEGVLKSAFDAQLIDRLKLTGDNVGQHVAWNMALDVAKAEGAAYFLRLDDDVEFPTKRWLRKLLDVSVAVDDKMILSPIVRGLNNPPRRSDPTLVRGFMLEFLIDAIGGICRLHPMSLITHPDHPFIADVRKPLGGEDATSMGAWCIENIIPMVYTRHIRVKHALTTEGQINADPEHFANHKLMQHIPYIPTWTRQTNGEVRGGAVSVV